MWAALFTRTEWIKKRSKVSKSEEKGKKWKEHGNRGRKITWRETEKEQL